MWVYVGKVRSVKYSHNCLIIGYELLLFFLVFFFFFFFFNSYQSISLIFSSLPKFCMPVPEFLGKQTLEEKRNFYCTKFVGYTLQMTEQVMFLYLSVPEVVSSLTQCYFGCHKIKLKFFFYLLFQVSTKLSGYFKTQLVKILLLIGHSLYWNGKQDLDSKCQIWVKYTPSFLFQTKTCPIWFSWLSDQF